MTEFIISAGILNGVVLSILLFRKKQKHAIIMAILCLCFSLSLFDIYQTNRLNLVFISRLTDSFPLLYGPLFFLYTYFLTDRKRRFRFLDGLNFLPFLVVFSSIFFVSNDAPPNSLLKVSWVFSSLLSGTFYTFLSLHYVNDYRLRLHNIRSNTEEMELKWLRCVIFVQIVLWTLAGDMMGMFIAGISSWHGMHTAIHIAYVLVIFFVGWRTMKEPTAQLPEEKEEPGEDALLKSLDDYVRESRIYLDPDLTREKLSQMSGISPSQITNVLNGTAGVNFLHYINRYRIDAVKGMLREGKSRTILAIAYEAGFNSKSTFNTMFRKFTGMTPTEYRKNIDSDTAE